MPTHGSQIAKEFRDEPALYFPHNLDFRGRAYPMHGNLNHLGSDVSRGMLHFAEGRPLGERGLYWLHVQVLAETRSHMLPQGRATRAAMHPTVAAWTCLTVWSPCEVFCVRSQACCAFAIT